MILFVALPFLGFWAGLSFGENETVNNEINYNLDDIIYDNVRQLIGSKSQQIGLDQHAEESVFWPLYIKYEKPLVDYVKDRLSIE